MNTRILVAVILGVAYLYGYYAIFKHQWKPSRFSWAIWVFIDYMILTTMVSATGWTTSAWLVVYYMIGSAIVAVLALKYGENQWGWFDIACLIAGVSSMLVWKVLGTPQIPLLLAVGGHLCGTLPTLRKAWLRPQNENSFVWSLYMVANTVAIYGVSGFAVSKWSWEAVLFPAYDFVGCTLVFIFSRRRASRE